MNMHTNLQNMYLLLCCIEVSPINTINSFTTLVNTDDISTLQRYMKTFENAMTHQIFFHFTNT